MEYKLTLVLTGSAGPTVSLNASAVDSGDLLIISRAMQGPLHNSLTMPGYSCTTPLYTCVKWKNIPYYVIVKLALFLDKKAANRTMQWQPDKTKIVGPEENLCYIRLL